MKNFRKKAAFWVGLGTSLFFAACTKDKTPTPAANLVGKWSIDQIIQTDVDSGQSVADTTSASQLDPCLQDNFTAFLSNGRGYSSPGATLCQNEVSQTDSFTYALSPDSRKLYLERSNRKDSLTIKTLTGSRLVVSQQRMMGSILRITENAFRKIP